MISAPNHPKEEQRLAALRRLRVLDSEAEAAFDDLTRLAASICQTPMALVSLVDEKRQWFKSRVGVLATETAREVAFCAHGILEKEVMIVPDAMQDVRFIDNPLVTESPEIRFYAGAPILTADGLPLGMMCVMDTVPREIKGPQKDALVLLSRIASNLLESRHAMLELIAANDAFKLLSGIIPICASCKKIRDEAGSWNILESYISHHSEASFTHGLCPECADRLYPSLSKSIKGS